MILVFPLIISVLLNLIIIKVYKEIEKQQKINKLKKDWKFKNLNFIFSFKKNKKILKIFLLV